MVRPGGTQQLIADMAVSPALHQLLQHGLVIPDPSTAILNPVQMLLQLPEHIALGLLPALIHIDGTDNGLKGILQYGRSPPAA